jgi:hypothetical protein
MRWWPRLLHSTSARPGRSGHRRQRLPISRRVVAPRCRLARRRGHQHPASEGGWQELAAAHSRSPSAARAPSACVLLSIATTDLRDESIRRRRGKDSRITIERHRERRRNIEGRNLERDFNVLRRHERRPRRMLCNPLAL